MSTLKVEQSFELKLNKKNTISNLQKLSQELPKFKRWLLITYYFPNGNYKKNIITLENPQTHLKKHLINNENFFFSMRKNLSEKSLTKIQIEICK